MNVISLARTRARNQHQEPSRSDDPFDFNGIVTGVTKVSIHIRTLNEYTQELVCSHGEFVSGQYELNLEKLSSPYQLELARLYIESIDREIEWACYGDDQTLNSDFLCAMLAMLKESNPETRDHFADVTTRNILIYYKEALQGLLNTACQDYYNNEMHEAGYHCEQDMEHGDFHWRKY